MQISEKLYEILKWACMIGIPALAVAYNGLAHIWNLPYPDEISKTANIICVLIGSLIGVSTIAYYRKKDGE